VPNSSSHRAILGPVSTMLTAAERVRVDAAGEGLYTAFHRDSIDDVIRDVKERRARAVLVSVTRYNPRDATRVAMLVREFPRVPTVALLTDLEPNVPNAVLTLGRSGIQTLVDVRQSIGWRHLRDFLLADQSRDICRLALSQLSADLVGAHPDCWRFFESLFTQPSGMSTIRSLSHQLGVVPSTLMSRFFRTKLPPPKRYLAMARLVRAAQLFENPGLSIANIADRLDYSSPQSFGRHVRGLIKITAVEFRQRYDGEGMLQKFRSDLVLPHLDVLRTFSPLVPLSPRSADKRTISPRVVLSSRLTNGRYDGGADYV
jgi:AraC-like DNA-binding protein